MRCFFVFGLVLVFGSTLNAQAVNLKGLVSNNADQPLVHAVVELVGQSAKDTADSDGNYSIVKSTVSNRFLPTALTESMRMERGKLEFTVRKPSTLKVEVFDVNGNIQKKEILPEAQPGVYQMDISSPHQANKILIVQASMGHQVRSFRYFSMQKNISEKNLSISGSGTRTLAKVAVAEDTLIVSADGYSTKKISLSSFDTTLNVTLEAIVPEVTASNVTTVPSSHRSPVSNPGEFTKNVTYDAYWYSTSATTADAFKSEPTIPRQNTPKEKFFHIYTPPDYDPKISYPLIIVMHGITDNPNMWVDRTDPVINVMLDNLITSGDTKPFIAVFASGTVDNNTNAYYAFGGELMNDLLPFIEENYSVRKDRAARAMAGFSFGGMQTLTIGLCSRLKEMAYFGGLHPAGPPTPNSTTIAQYMEQQEPEKYPLYYLYIGRGTRDQGAGASSADGLTGKSPYISSANFSSQDNITGGNGSHNYQSAQVALFNLLKMAFAAD